MLEIRAKKAKNVEISNTTKVINGDMHLKKSGYTQRTHINAIISKVADFIASLLLNFSHPSIIPPIVNPKQINEIIHNKYITVNDIAHLGNM